MFMSCASCVIHFLRNCIKQSLHHRRISLYSLHQVVPQASHLLSKLSSHPKTNTEQPALFPPTIVLHAMAVCSKLMPLIDSARPFTTSPSDCTPVNESGMGGFWICCHCGHANNPKTCPKRCGNCPHTTNYCCSTSSA